MPGLTALHLPLYHLSFTLCSTTLRPLPYHLLSSTTHYPLSSTFCHTATFNLPSIYPQSSVVYLHSYTPILYHSATAKRKEERKEEREKGRRKEGEKKEKGRRKEGERKEKGRKKEGKRKEKGRKKEGERKEKGRRKKGGRKEEERRKKERDRS